MSKIEDNLKFLCIRHIKDTTFSECLDCEDYNGCLTISRLNSNEDVVSISPAVGTSATQGTVHNLRIDDSFTDVNNNYADSCVFTSHHSHSTLKNLPEEFIELANQLSEDQIDDVIYFMGSLLNNEN